MKRTKSLPSFEGVAAGAQATLRLPLQGTYKQIYVLYSGVTLAQMTGIRLKGNGQTFQDFRGADKLNTINQYHGRAAASGILVLDLERINLRTRQGEELTGVGTGLDPQRDANGNLSVELSTFTLEIDIAAAASGPTLEAYADIDAPTSLGLIKHVRPFTYNAPATGDYEISDIPKGHLWSTVHMFNGDIDKLQIERNSLIVFERTDALNRLVQADGERVPQTDVFTFDPTEIGNGGEALVTAGARDLRLRLTMSGTGAIPLYVESIAPLI